ncbi:MAG: 3-hydroxyacyl-ACP dehydratase FabZ [Desulfatiglans sp.]|jgi:beta-hydroxyacyl-ACP dehydratase FabZ|nr:3-hydroxyacyl-ACP dehydratase FabZ [Desulfatiglans sp.]
MELPIKYQDIVKLLPHRYPFLLVDRVTEYEPLKRIVGYKNVTANEAFFQGHFPGNPIMPGVLIIEAMAQTGGILSRLSMMEGESGQNEPRLMIFLSMDNVKFRRQVVPGDQLKFVIETLRTGSKIWKLAGKAFVDEELAAEAEMTAQLF